MANRAARPADKRPEVQEAIGEAEEVPKDVLDRLEARASSTQRAGDEALARLQAEQQRVRQFESNPSAPSEHRREPPPPPEPPRSAVTLQTKPPEAEVTLDGVEQAKSEEKPAGKPDKGEEGGKSDDAFKGKQGGEGYHRLRVTKSTDGKDGDADKGGKEADLRRTLLPSYEAAPTAAKLLVFGPEGRRVAIKPRAVRVVAFVQGPRARTIVDYVFENPYERRLEGTFFHAMPGDASPAGFAMFDGTRQVANEAFFESAQLLPDLPKAMIDPEAIQDLAPAATAAPAKKRGMDWGPRKDAKVVEQKRAREVYEAVVRQNIDPALLEWSGGGNFEARVFPLEPKSLKRVVVAYEQPLLFDGTAFRYAYTLPTDASIKERAATLFLDASQGAVRESPAPAKGAHHGKWTRFDLAAPVIRLACAIEPASKNVALRGHDKSGLGGDPFYAEIRPELAAGRQTPTGRALLLIDTSLSTEEGSSYVRRTKLIRALLERDPSIKQFAVALFDVRVRWPFGTGWQDNTAANRGRMTSALSEVYLEGATNFAAVLEELRKNRSWAIEGAPTTAFLFSDGQITWGMDRLDELERRYPVLGDVRWVSYRFGEEPVNKALFDLLSNRSKGQTVALLSEAEVDAAAVAHREPPVELASVRVEGAEAADLVVGGDPSRVFRGQTLYVAGRILGSGSARLVVSLGSGGRAEAALPAKGAAEADELAPRAWAELYAKKLVAFDDQRLDRMVVALSQHYRLANARASFLVLDREEDWTRYALKDERVDLSNLEALRKKEQDARRDRALGIALDEVGSEGQAVVEIFKRRTDGMPPLLAAEPLVEAPSAGGEERAAAEAAYRAARKNEKLDDLMYDRIGRIRALAGDTSGALRALSCTVELRPQDTEAMRLVGYALLALAQYGPASEIFERVRLRRPFEGEAYLEEAIALDALGRFDQAARNYEIVLARTWSRHDREVRVVAAYHYARLIRALVEANRGFTDADRRLLEMRLGALQSAFPEVRADAPIDLQLTTLWSTDDIDIDLWVYEPNGEKCFYGHRTTDLGGKLYWDVTDGLGPELYQAAKAHSGAYETMVHYYGGRAPRMAAPTAMLMVVDKNLFKPDGAASRRFQMRLLPKRDAVLMMRTDTF